MLKRWVGPAVLSVLVVAAAGTVWWLSRPAAAVTGVPKNAPATGSCWNVPDSVAATPFPWPGRPVGCDATHTVEVFTANHVGQDLINKAAHAEGTQAKIVESLMGAVASRYCVANAPGYLGGDYHRSRVQVIAQWVKPGRAGHFGCAVAESPAPASKRLTPRTGSLRGALRTPGPLAIACVAKDGDAHVYSGCDVPHDGEFIGTHTLTPAGAPFNGPKVQEAAQSGCDKLMREFVGADRSDLRAAYVGPTSPNDWLGSDQTFTCYAVTTGTAPLTRTIKGLGSAPLPA